MNPSLTVIIVTWRSRDEILDCVRSIPSTLCGGAVDVVVIDNSLNADGTADVLAREVPTVRCLVPPENLGFGRGNNLGFRESSGECVLFLNPDTVCNVDALEHCLARVRNDTEVGLISPKLVLADGSMDLACRRSIPTAWDGFCRASGLAARFPKVKRFSGYNLTYLPDDGTYEVGAINGAFMLGRREVFERVAEEVQRASASDAPTRTSKSCVFDEQFFMYGDDLDLCIRVAKAGYRIVYDGRVAITHLKGQSVAKDYARMSQAIFDANRDVYLKHFNPRSSRWVEWKYRVAFGLWKRVAQLRAALVGHRQVRPL
ncbi:MAG: glycosyltransferase family 2 protein [Opitutaceae bacterium]